MRVSPRRASRLQALPAKGRLRESKRSLCLGGHRPSSCLGARQPLSLLLRHSSSSRGNRVLGQGPMGDHRGRPNSRASMPFGPQTLCLPSMPGPLQQGMSERSCTPTCMA